jgi:hypothetical protein
LATRFRSPSAAKYLPIITTIKRQAGISRPAFFGPTSAFVLKGIAFDGLNQTRPGKNEAFSKNTQRFPRKRRFFQKNLALRPRSDTFGPFLMKFGQKTQFPGPKVEFFSKTLSFSKKN